jgi:hypothetical protein
MARRKAGRQPAVSLFPFLSILACVIGTLTLMIAGLAISQMDTPELASAEQLEKTKRRIDELKTQLADLQQQIKKSRSRDDATALKLLDKQQELYRIQKELRDLQAKELPKAPAAAAMIDTKSLQQRIEQLQKELTERQAAAKKLAEELANRKKPPEEAVVMVRPTGSGVGLKPNFVECTSTSLVLHQGPSPKRIRKADIASSTDYLNLVETVAKQEKERIVFLVRDDGLSTYSAASRVAQDKYARAGKIPIIGQGKLDLSMFQKR